jgi:hypothetical protein
MSARRPRSIAELAPLEAATHPDVEPRAQYTGFPGRCTMRAMVHNRLRGTWYLDLETTGIIADKLELDGHAQAPEFREAWVKAGGLW